MTATPATPVVISQVIANLITVVLISTIYLNYRLFSQYAYEVFYGFLLSEALFTWKASLIEALQRSYHPRRRMAETFFSSPRRTFATIFFSSCAMFYAISTFVVLQLSSSRGGVNSSEPVLSTFSIHLSRFIVVIVFLIPTYIWILDDKSTAVFKFHHLLRISDDAAVSLFLIITVVGMVTVFLGSFALLSLRDATTFFESISALIDENYLRDPETARTLKNVVTQSKLQIEEVSRTLNAQYERTAFEPLVRLLTSAVANATMQIEQLDAPILVTDLYERLETSRESIMRDEAAYEFYLHSRREAWNAARALLDWSTVRTFLTGTTDQILSGASAVLSLAFAILDGVVRFGFFITVLFVLLSSSRSVSATVFGSMLEVFPEEDEAHRAPVKKFEEELHATFESVFKLPISLSVANATCVILLFSLFNLTGARLHGQFFAATLAIFLTIFPLVSPHLVVLPWCLVCAFRGNQFVALALFLATYLSLDRIYTYLVTSFFALSKEIPVPDATKITSLSRHAPVERSISSQQTEFAMEFATKWSYVTGLSFFVGINAFGVHGVVVGPLVISVLYTLYTTFLAQYKGSMQRRLSEAFSPSAT